MNMREKTDEFMDKLFENICRKIYEASIQNRITDPYKIFKIGLEIGINPDLVDKYIPDDESKKEDEKQ